jgi:hypothetical protein
VGIFFDAAIYSTAIRLRCRLFIVPSGHGSPCLDLRRVSSEVVDAALGTDLGGTDAAPHRPYFTYMRLTSQSHVAPPQSSLRAWAEVCTQTGLLSSRLVTAGNTGELPEPEFAAAVFPAR